MSSFGRVFRITTFGESHGKSVGVVIDGVPPNLVVNIDEIQAQLNRRRPGQSHLTTSRNEADLVEVCSGLMGNITLGTPLMMKVDNKDVRAEDYVEWAEKIPRPSHADFAYKCKYSVTARSGGGRASARETIGRVAAGAVAEVCLRDKFGIEIVAFVSGVGKILWNPADLNVEIITRAIVDQSVVRCPNMPLSSKMEDEIINAKKQGDSVGGFITCIIRNVLPGIGEPVFDKLSAELAKAMLSIPSVRSFELGSGIEGCQSRGSEQNDMFVLKGNELRTSTNNSGGIQGGISNGEMIYFRVGFKPPSTIGKSQKTSNYDGDQVEFQAKGRHDPCVVPRAVPIVESMTALVLIDALGIQKARESLSFPIEQARGE